MEIIITIKTDEDVKVSIEQKKAETINEKNYLTEDYNVSRYAKYFDQGGQYWTDNAEYNLMFLKDQQNHSHDLLKMNGKLYLNDVYDMLGIPRTKDGQVVGWVYKEENPVGDNFVDFGIYDMCINLNRDFIHGREKTVLLDFNVDGFIG